MNSLVLALSAIFYGFCQAQFQVLDADAIANITAVTLSDACLDALQGTVNCNSSLVNIAAADSFYGIDNETYVFLCNDGCSSSLESYHSSVSSACAGQDEAWSGYPATYFGDVYWATYNLSCLAEPISGSSCMGNGKIVKTDYFNTIASNYTDDISPTSLPSSVACSPCVLELYKLLQKTPYSYYDSDMVSDWSAIQTLCGVSYPTEVPQNPTNVTDIPGFAPANYSTPSCLSESTYAVVSGDNCIAISQAQNVSTGALIALNNLLPDCSNLDAGASLCLPQACEIYTVQAGDTCASITNATGISFVQFTSWNPTINSYCTNLLADQEFCVGQAGAVWTGTTIPGASTTQSGVYATTTVAAPSNLAYGTTTDCGRYYDVQSGDDCSLIALNNTITISLFEAINPSVNADCSNLIPGLSYCVFPVASWNSTNATTTATASYVTAPAATVSGTTSDCYEWHVVVSGDYCALLESEYGITFAQLQDWNPNLNSACGNLVLGDAYCVDGPSIASGSSVTVGSATATVAATAALKL
ncbi:LysM domain protein [Penicillium sp. IBT 16267x]|nr:LysM domain protein [Penicillium sp. IBT 16267x]